MGVSNVSFIRQGNRRWTEPCDYAGIAFGLCPNLELPSLLGCRIVNDAVAVDEYGKASVEDIYCVGECTGIGGVDLSLLEGEIAGYAAAGRHDRARTLFAARDKARDFANRLNSAFALREELKFLPKDDTFVCRCEDVSLRSSEKCVIVSRRETAYPLRHGPLPGPRLRARNSVSFWMACGIDPTAHLPGEGWKPRHRRSRSRGGGTDTTMKQMNWRGVIPAMTTPFNADLSVDHGFLATHCKWLIDNGCKGVVALGSLGEGATLTPAEKNQVLETCVKAIGDRAYVVAGVSSLSTAEAVSIAKSAEERGCNGLMVLPPYVYIGDWREMKAHVERDSFQHEIVVHALQQSRSPTRLIFSLSTLMNCSSEFPHLQAIKESSADVRRVSALRSIAGDRLQIAVGVDDVVVEAVYAGAIGWIAGLVNAFPEESVRLFELARDGKTQEAFELYRWFLPLLRLDTVPKFVQLIKLVQEEVGMGNQRVRPPRLTLTGDELAQTKKLVADSLKTRPQLVGAR